MQELTPRQQEILRLVAAGCTNRQVGRALALTERTVGKHLENIYVRLGARSRTEAVAAAGVLPVGSEIRASHSSGARR